MVRAEAHLSVEAGKLPPGNPGQVRGSTYDLSFQPHPPAQIIGAASSLLALVSQESPQVWRMTQAPSQGGRRKRSHAWSTMAGQVIGERRKAAAAAMAVVAAIAVVVTDIDDVVAVVGVVEGALLERSGWSAY